MLKFSHNYPLSQATTLGIGGPAKLFVAVQTQAELIEAIQYTIQHELSYLVIGGGSNLLINDKGINCLVIRNEISGIESDHLRGEKMRLHLGGVVLKVKSGTVLQDLVDYTIKHELSGLQKLTGIPGTVGGAVYGNAGAYGQTISDHISFVVILSPTLRRTKNLKIVSKNDCGFGYRDSIFKKTKDPILAVTFQLKNSSSTEELQQEADEVLQKRLIKYPKGIKCPGSFFKNIVAETLPKNILTKIPPDKITYGKISAGYLLEAVGAQGQSLDGIEIASYHANLFINKDKGTTKAFYNLAKKYAQKVKEKFGIALVPEVQLINLPPIL